MFCLALPTFYSTRICQSFAGLSASVGLFLLVGWQQFWAVLLAGLQFTKFWFAEIQFGDRLAGQSSEISAYFSGNGLQGIRFSRFQGDWDGIQFHSLDLSEIRLDARFESAENDRETRTAGAIAAFFGLGLAILGLIARQLNMSGRCRFTLLLT